MSIQQDSVEVLLSIEMDSLYKVLSQLTLQKKKEIQAFLETAILNDERKSPMKKLTNRAFLNTELGDSILKNDDSSIDIRKIRRELSVTQDSLADDVNQNREER